MIKQFKSNLFGFGYGRQNIAFHRYASCFRISAYPGNASLVSLEFEKKLCHGGFRKTFGMGLPSESNIKLGLAMCNQVNNQPKMSTPWQSLNNRHKPCPPRPLATLPFPFASPLQRQKAKDEAKSQRQKNLGLAGLKQLSSANHGLMALSMHTALGVRPDHAHPVRSESVLKKASENTSLFKTAFVCSGTQLMSADWLMEHLKEQLSSKRGSRAVLNNTIRDVTKLMAILKSSCPVLGVTIVATGRLGKRKKGMAQQIRRSVGKVPHSTFRHKIDYCQDFVTSPLGAIGLKVWICYGS
jgi:Ribosomal protein S3, C-terminal domain